MDLAPPEELLLREALDLDASSSVVLRSREPLGEGSVAGFDVTAAGEAAITYFVDTSHRVVARETGFATGTPDEPGDRVWLHPADPHLPALAPVAFGHAAEALLRRLGLAAHGTPELVAYRPGRRAVLRMPTAGRSVWIKVVPPTRVGRIVETHRELAIQGIPVPAVLGWSDEGLLVLDAAIGTPAQDAAWEPGGFVDEVDGLRARFAGVPLRRAARTHLDRRLKWYVARLRVVFSDDRRALVDRIDRAAHAEWGEADTATIHGDLHFGQLFLDERMRISAVIDVDTAGAGAAVDDAAAFVSHAVASAVLTPVPRDERVWALARCALERWDAEAGLRARTATHLLGHALAAVETGHRERADRLLRAAASVVDRDPSAIHAP
ncbi:phosphotransferase [Microbacterium sp. 2FI]|uniref:phosphotransferase n=1 Tax=Microbacterium sp. 2FI TaxID=2502193 RepID=UPI0010F89F21|nr:phosphotransferase [Microbacterium sp. 2FI]